MHFKSLAEIQSALIKGEITMIQIVSFYLENIKKSAHLNAYIEVFEGEINAQAEMMDKKIKNNPNDLGSLYGCVVSIKDLICYKNHQINAGSKILSNFESQFSATAVEAVLSEDALIIGRTNCDEFGMGSSNTNSYFGPVGNGADETRVSGGSSGGAAVSIQTNTCLIALGTDTGGSVRQPASMCGVIGFKPSYGLVSRHGLIAYASSFDQLGILGHNITDIDKVMSVVSRNDEFDATMFSKDLYKEQKVDKRSLSEIKIAYFTNVFENKALDSEIKTASNNYIEELRSKNITVEKIDFPLMDLLVPCYYILTVAEASSNLGRYDGVRYGYRSDQAKNLEEMYVKSRTEGFGREVKKRIMLGSFVLSEAYYDAYFNKAQQIRTMIKEKMAEIFTEYDFVIMPTSPKTAWLKNEKFTDPLDIYMADIYTVLANLAGIPAISIPLNNNKKNMPFGIQILGNVKRDRELLMFLQNYSLA